MASTSGELLAGLPDTFRYSEALGHVSERQLRGLVAEGQITALSRGLYRKSDWLGDEDLVEIAAKSPRATLRRRRRTPGHTQPEPDTPNDRSAGFGKHRA